MADAVPTAGQLTPGSRRGDVDEAGLVTPEAVVLGLPVASVGSRAAAVLVDVLLQGLALVLLFFAAGTVGAGLGGWIGVSILLLAVFAILYGYPAVLEAFWGGRTLGKALFGLRVVTVEAGPVTFRHAAIRAALATVDLHLTSGGVAVVSALFSRRAQRLGDLAAGTVVIRERSGAGGLEAATFHAPAGAEAYTARLDTSGLDEDDYVAVRSVLVRRSRLDDATLAGLASQVAHRLQGRIAPAPPPGMPPLVFLHCVAASHQARHRARTDRAVGDWVWSAPGDGSAHDTGPTSSHREGAPPRQ